MKLHCYARVFYQSPAKCCIGLVLLFSLVCSSCGKKEEPAPPPPPPPAPAPAAPAPAEPAASPVAAKLEAKRQDREKAAAEELEAIRQAQEKGTALPEISRPKPQAIPQVQDPFAAADQVIKQMEKANISFNTPKTVNRYDTVMIQLLLSLTKTADELQGQITGRGEKETASVPVSGIMEARLTGPNFQITASHRRNKLFHGRRTQNGNGK